MNGVLQERKIGGITIRLSDDPNSRTDYRIAIIKNFPSLYEAMDFLRVSEQDLRKSGKCIIQK